MRDEQHVSLPFISADLRRTVWHYEDGADPHPSVTSLPADRLITQVIGHYILGVFIEGQDGIPSPKQLRIARSRSTDVELKAVSLSRTDVILSQPIRRGVGHIRQLSASSTTPFFDRLRRKGANG